DPVRFRKHRPSQIPVATAPPGTGQRIRSHLPPISPNSTWFFSTSSPTAPERKSIVLTTNLGFEQWTKVLGPERLTGAALDRLTHRCVIDKTSGESDCVHDANR
ncbi:MAG: ATP-binding protein, partial [Gemmataceae bacterium]|nr:ATP-binding protein [Gemmataceae bacterium]